MTRAERPQATDIIFDIHERRQLSIFSGILLDFQNHFNLFHSENRDVLLNRHTNILNNEAASFVFQLRQTTKQFAKDFNIYKSQYLQRYIESIMIGRIEYFLKDYPKEIIDLVIEYTTVSLESDFYALVEIDFISARESIVEPEILQQMERLIQETPDPVEAKTIRVNIVAQEYKDFLSNNELPPPSVTLNDLIVPMVILRNHGDTPNQMNTFRQHEIAHVFEVIGVGNDILSKIKNKFEFEQDMLAGQEFEYAIGYFNSALYDEVLAYLFSNDFLPTESFAEAYLKVFEQNLITKGLVTQPFISRYEFSEYKMRGRDDTRKVKALLYNFLITAKGDNQSNSNDYRWVKFAHESLELWSKIFQYVGYQLRENGIYSKYIYLELKYRHPNDNWSYDPSKSVEDNFPKWFIDEITKY